MLYLVLFHFLIYLLILFDLFVEQHRDFVEAIFEIIVFICQARALLIDFDQFLFLFDSAFFG
jgi:hypothetical protein